MTQALQQERFELFEYLAPQHNLPIDALKASIHDGNLSRNGHIFLAHRKRHWVGDFVMCTENSLRKLNPEDLQAIKGFLQQRNLTLGMISQADKDRAVCFLAKRPHFEAIAKRHNVDISILKEPITALPLAALKLSKKFFHTRNIFFIGDLVSQTPKELYNKLHVDWADIHNIRKALENKNLSLGMKATEQEMAQAETAEKELTERKTQHLNNQINAALICYFREQGIELTTSNIQKLKRRTAAFIKRRIKQYTQEANA